LMTLVIIIFVSHNILFPVLLTQQYSLLNPVATGDIDNITWR